MTAAPARESSAGDGREREPEERTNAQSWKTRTGDESKTLEVLVAFLGGESEL